ncbi:BatA domain-containing protein, partial [Enterovirga sp.]|uniref:BatA domain-containing protein n=1 Tax=Enterovirga sp. TaxID=2026350 RepID=UPI002627DBF9
MLGLPLTFAVPAVLAALATLPAIWFLLRVTPPQPRRIDFPPLRILADLLPERQTPARTPPWLLLLRLLVAALLILAASGPLWNPGAAGGAGPLLLILDNGFPAAGDWRERAAYAEERVQAAVREGRATAILATADRPAAIAASAPGAALERVRAVKPQPYLVDRRPHLDSIRAYLATARDAEIVWIADRTAGAGDAGFAPALAEAAGARRVAVIAGPRSGALALAGAENAPAQLSVRVVRAEANGRDSGTLRASDLRGLPLAQAPFTFPAGAVETQASFTLPMEVRNAIARVDIQEETSAGAAALFDDRGRRRRVGLVSGASADQAQPLLSPTYYLARALGPYSELREAPGGVSEAISAL